MRPGDEGLWDEIQRDAEPYFSIEPGLFVEEFGADLEAAWERVFLVTEPGGREVGTMGAWYRTFEGRDYGLIHWVAVRPAFQGLGLAKASLAGALEVLARHHEAAYLITQSKRIPAISLYLDAGFRPHCAADRGPGDLGRTCSRHDSAGTPRAYRPAPRGRAGVTGRRSARGTERRAHPR